MARCLTPWSHCLNQCWLHKLLVGPVAFTWWQYSPEILYLYSRYHSQKYARSYTFQITATSARGLTHWGRVTHICVGNLTIIGSDNGLSPGRRQAIIWNNAGLLLIGPLGTNFSEILIGIQTFSFTKMHLNVSSAKWRPFCLGLNELRDKCTAVWWNKHRTDWQKYQNE